MIWLILWILVAHWIADFILQSDRMALGKSKGIGWLSVHAVIYSIAMILMVGTCIPMWGWIILALSHFIIDGLTSRVCSYMWEKEMRHWFFVVIGLDQLLHYAVLLSIMEVPA